jgi:hypothetical protein
MTGRDGSQPGWGAPPPGGPQYNQPYYPPQYSPQPQYPPPPGYQQQPQQPYGPPQQYQQPYGPPIVIPIEGKGAAKLAAKMNRRSLVVGPEGIAHEGKQTFRIAWPELRRVAITTAYHQNTTKMFAPKVWRVRIVMDAADPGFPQRHPEIGGLQGKFGASGAGSYGLPLGPTQNLVGQIAHAFATYGGQVFGGVIEEGMVMGFTYL